MAKAFWITTVWLLSYLKSCFCLLAFTGFELWSKSLSQTLIFAPWEPVYWTQWFNQFHKRLFFLAVSWLCFPPCWFHCHVDSLWWHRWLLATPGLLVLSAKDPNGPDSLLLSGSWFSLDEPCSWDFSLQQRTRVSSIYWQALGWERRSFQKKRRVLLWERKGSDVLGRH